MPHGGVTVTSNADNIAKHSLIYRSVTSKKLRYHCVMYMLLLHNAILSQ